MARKVYSETVKKWALGLGLSGGTLIGLYFMYLSILGAITITGYSGDSVCAGTTEDPCYAYINFTANEDIFIYKVGYDPYGRNSTFAFDPAVESWILQRSWGTGWRTIPLNESCTGTWCGLSNAQDTRDFSVAFRKGQKYQIRIVGYKKRADDVIKWSALDGRVDPTWDSANIRNITNQTLNDYVFPNLISNDGFNTDAEFQINNPLNKNVDISNLRINFNVQCGEVKSYTILIRENRTQTIQNNYYDVRSNCTNVTNINGTIKECSDIFVLNHTETISETKSDFYPATVIKKGVNTYKVVADVKMERCNDYWGYEVEWVPEILINTDKYTQKKWAWWDTSYTTRRPINCTWVNQDVPMVINGSMGFSVGGVTQIVWTPCKTGAYVYDNGINITVANDTDKLPYEIEVGNGTSNDVAQVWPNYTSVWHGNAFTDSLGNNNLTQAVSTVSIISNSTCKFGKCWAFDTATGYLHINVTTGLPTGNAAITLHGWVLGPISAATDDKALMAYGKPSNGAEQYLTMYDAAGYFGCWGSNYGTLAMNPIGWDRMMGVRPAGNVGTFYLNRSSNGGTKTTSITQTGPLRIGSGITTSNASYGEWGAGAIRYVDEVRIATVALPLADVNSTYFNAMGTAGYGTLDAAETYTSPVNYSIDKCSIISSPGSYTLVTDLLEITTDRCMIIRTNNAVFNCQGYTIDADDPGNAFAAIGAYDGENESTVFYKNITIKDCILNDWHEGAGITGSFNDSLFYNITSTDCGALIDVDEGSYHTIVENNTAKDSLYQCLWTEAVNITFRNNRCQGSGQVIFYSTNSTNIFYNNLFNGTLMYYLTSNNKGIFNTTNQTGTRIFSAGTLIGGNYWTNSSATGYSDTCTDADKDGFCDSPYNISTNSSCTAGVDCGDPVDYWPLSNKYGASSCTYGGSGNWVINLADYCRIGGVNVTGTINFTGAGNMTCVGSINSTSIGDPGASGTIYVNESCDWKSWG